MKPTAKEVAHIAGVSIAAVSRAFTPGASLDTGKRKRILAAAEEIGYTSPARRTAEAIAAGTVTLLAGDLLNPFYPVVLDTLAKHLQLCGKQLLVYALPAAMDVDTSLVQILASRPSALIVTSAYLTSNVARTCRQHQIKIVLLNRVQRDIKINSVACDNYAGGRDAASLLLAKGHQRIGFLGGVINTSTHMERARGFRDVLGEANISLCVQAIGNFNYKDAYVATLDILSSPQPPSALFCCNDIMALAAIDAAREKGAGVPEDLAIIGFDDIPMASWNAYKLTTVRQPIERMVREALDIIEDSSIRPQDDGATRLLPGTMISRASA